MTITLLSLDNLIEQVREHHPYTTSGPLDRVADSAQVAASVSQLGEHLVDFFIDEARRDGNSWTVIGERLGISRQAVQKRYAAQSGDGSPKRPSAFDRLANDGKRIVKQSEEEARSRQSGHRSTEHFLRAIAAEPESVGAKSLARCGATAPVIIAAVNGRIGVPSGEPSTGEILPTPGGSAVFEHALRESVRLGHDYVGSGHIALGCLTVRDGLAAEILGNLGVTYNDLRQAVIELAGANPPKFSARRADWEQPGA